MKKVLLVYRGANRNELKTVSHILVAILRKFDIDCKVETCSLFRSKELLNKDYDLIAGYHIDVQEEFALSKQFYGKYLHFFEKNYTFAFANVTKQENMGGFNMYKIASLPVSSVN